MEHVESKILKIVLSGLKERFGINQIAVAKILGISIQALTDAKHGRRAFPPHMAEKLLAHYQSEPWADWLAEQLKDLAAPVEPPLFPPPDPKTVVPVDTVVHPVFSDGPCIPLMLTPILGDFAVIDTRCERYVELPKWVIPLIPENSSPYILEVADDDYAGRLRMGDHVLVVQTAIPAREIMIVDHNGGLKLARNACFDASRADGRLEWIALDSGVPLQDATPVAAVLGVIMARL